MWANYLISLKPFCHLWYGNNSSYYCLRRKWNSGILGMCSIIILAITYLLPIWMLSLCETGVGKLIGMEDTSISLGPYIQFFFSFMVFSPCVFWSLLPLDWLPQFFLSGFWLTWSTWPPILNLFDFMFQCPSTADYRFWIA